MYLALAIVSNLLVWSVIKGTVGFTPEVSIMFLLFCTLTGLLSAAARWK